MKSSDSRKKNQEIFRSEFPTEKGSWKLEWRLLSLARYRHFHTLRAEQKIHPFLIYKKVFDECFVGDINLISSKMPLFIPVTVGNLIMHLSGDSNADTIANEIAFARNTYDPDDIIEIMKKVICIAFEHTDWDDLEEYTKYELISKFVIAESMLMYKTSGSYQPLDLSKLVRADQIGSSSQTKEVEVEYIDFERENDLLVKTLDPYELEQNGFINQKLTTEQARKLDKLSKKSR